MTEKYFDKEWVCIWEEKGYWEYQLGDDDESYISGSFLVDDENEKQIIDYDGCYELPKAVLNYLKELGYDITEIEVKDE